MPSTLKPQLTSDMKSSMKSGDKQRLGVVRLMLAAIKQIEVDERIELDDTRILAVLDKMVKQRRESISHYSNAGRDDLVAVEQAEIDLIQEYLPEALSEAEINDLVEQSIATTGAASIKDMGKLMGVLKPQLQGRADMGKVSQLIKSRPAFRFRLVLFQGDIAGFRATQMIQVKAQPAENGMPFSRAATLDCIIWVAPFGRAVKQSLAALHLLTRNGPLSASCALRSTASRLAEPGNITLKEH